MKACLQNPAGNAFIEASNGTLRAACLETNWFQWLLEATQIIEVWDRNALRVVRTVPWTIGRRSNSPGAVPGILQGGHELVLSSMIQ